MSYIQRVLQPGEQVRHTASIHWIVYWPGVVMLVVAAVLWWYAIYPPAWATPLLATINYYLAAVCAVVALILAFREWFIWWTTEIAVTDRRVIYKRGFIWRKTNEMNMEKVESVQVDQSIVGRILDYGDVTVIGTGEGMIGRRVRRTGDEGERASKYVEGDDELRRVARPLELRNHITGV